MKNSAKIAARKMEMVMAIGKGSRGRCPVLRRRIMGTWDEVIKEWQRVEGVVLCCPLRDYNYNR